MLLRPPIKGSTFNGGGLTAKKVDSLTGVSSTGGTKMSLSDVDKNFSLGGKAGPKDSNKAAVSSIPKAEPKNFNGKPAETDKSAIKVPTIKRKI